MAHARFGICRRSPLVLFGLVAAVSGAVALPPIAPAGAQTGPVTNPPIADSCGIDVTLVLDASGSISSSNAVDDVRNAGEAFLDALADTGSTARVLQFATLSEELAAFAEVTQASLEPGGSFRSAIDDYYNPKPPRPGNVNIYSYRGSGNPQSSGSWSLSNNSNQYTNWDQSLRQAGEAPSELVLYITDGDPTAYDFDQPGDPFDPGPPPDVGVNTNRGSANSVTLDRAVAEADGINAAGTRVLAVGVGAALQNEASRARLVRIAGPQVVEDADLPSVDSINEVDVALVTDFAELASFLRSVVNQLCAPSLSIRKLAQSADSAEYVSTPGWDITATPSVTGGTFDWILPDTDADALARCGSPTDPTDQSPRTCATDASGLANFQWEPDPSDRSSQVRITESRQPGFTVGRPGADNDWSCRIKDVDGSESTVSGELDDGDGFDLTIESEQIVTCSIYNSFDYEPDVGIVKVNAPAIVRGDLTAGDRQVTSTYTVTNEGNTPLSGVVVHDDIGPDRTCTPVSFDGGDADGDGLLDLDETWIFTCTTAVGGPSGTYVNTADVVGSSPDQQLVTDIDDDDVDVVRPGIELDKVVAGGGAGPADVITVPDGTDVTYTFTATNTGDTTLEDVAVTDPTCGTAVTPASVASLAPGATADFTCDLADVIGDVVNTATVSGTPAIPGYTGPNPDVTDADTAEVKTFAAAIELTKSVDRPLVFPGTAVTYTFGVSLPDVDDEPIVPTDAAGSPVPRANWVIDPLCAAPPAFQSGDDGDEVLEPTEVWVYTCTRTIDVAAINLSEVGAVVNTAEVFGVPQGAPDPQNLVSDDASAVVRLVVPLVDVVKTRSRDTVLDPPSTCPPATLPCAPILGPDTPSPRTVDYLFEVRNPGTIALDLAPDGTYPTAGDRRAAARITDTVGDEPACSPTYAAGDDDDDGFVDPSETWVFECPDIALTKAQAANGFDVVNTVEVVANGVLPGNPPERGPEVSATDTTGVQVITPNYSLTKTASATLVRPDTEVTYTYELTHTGDPVGLDVLGVVDDLCSPVVYVSGDDAPPAGNGVLQQGETWIYECTQVVRSPDDPSTPTVENEVTNTALAAAVGPLGNLYLRDATATVQVFDPSITLTKSVDDDFVPVGTEVSYTFTVTNSGDDIDLDELTDILLADVANPALPSCTNPTLVDPGDGDDVLSVGEVWTYGCSATVQANTVNLAGVRGTDIADGFVFDAASAFVAVYEAGIQVVKSASPIELEAPGGPVTYGYQVTNTGNVPLADVVDRITDDTCSPVTYVAGDLDGNGLLTGDGDLFETGPPEVWTFTCTATVSQDTTNTVVVEGTPVNPGGTDGPEVLGPDVTDEDTATVNVVTVTPRPPTPTTAPPIAPTIPPTGGGGRSTVPFAWAILAAGLALVAVTRRRHA